MLSKRRTDFEIACSYERELFYTHQDFPGEEDLQLELLAHLNGPLLVGPTTFSPSEDLSLPATLILQDVQKLTSLVNSPSTVGNITEIQLEASLLYNKFKALPTSETTLYASEQERIFETIRLAALVYTSSISTLTPFAQHQKNPELQELHTHISGAVMSTWKKIPAIFLWVLLVACCSAKNDDWGKWLRKKMATTGMALGLEDFGVAMQCLKRFWIAQRWIAWCNKDGEVGVAK